MDGTINASSGASVGVPVNLEAIGGFALGCDPLNNPGTDAPILSASTPASITPTVIELDKLSDTDEGETATGPNHPITYTLRVNIANLETLTDVTVQDDLPSNLVYLPGSLSVTDAATAIGVQTIVSEPTGGTARNPPDNRLAIHFDTVTGSLSEGDIVIQYQAYASDVDADGLAVIPAASGDDRQAADNAQVTGTHASGSVGDDDASTDYQLELRSIAVQKGVDLVSDPGPNGAICGHP